MPDSVGDVPRALNVVGVRLRAEFNGAALVARAGVAAALHEWRSQRQTAVEDPEFRELWPRIDRVPGWLRRDEGSVLYHLARFGGGHGDVVEIGSYQGRSTACLGSGVRSRGSGHLHAVDPHTGDRGMLTELGLERVNTEQAFRRNMEALGLERVVVPHITTSLQAAESYPGAPVTLLFIDGWHSFDAVTEDFYAWQRYLRSESVVVFDDWHDDEVRAAVVALRRAGQLPPCAFRSGKMIGFAPRRIRAGRLPLRWVRV